jgi:hypothetical protein
MIIVYQTMHPMAAVAGDVLPLDHRAQIRSPAGKQ